MLRLLKQYFPIRNILFFIIEWFVIFGSFLISTIILTEHEPFLFNLSLYLKIFLVVCVCQSSLYYNDLYDFKIASTIVEVSIRLFQSLGFTSIVLAMIYWAIPVVVINQLVFMLSIGFVLIFIIGWRLLYIFIIKKGIFNQNIILLGSSPLAFDILKEIDYEPDCGYSVCVMIPDSEEEALNANISEKIIVRTEKQDLCSLAKETGINKVVVALKEQRGLFPTQELIRCRTAGIEVIEGSSFYEMLTGKVLVTKIKPSWLIFSEGFRKSKLTNMVKRIEDIFISLIMLILLSPILLIISILIKMESKGRILFSQDRVGQKKKEFQMHKFRSMVEDAEKLSGPVWAQNHDPRITKVGKIIRRFRIDELPQLWDVLTGKMSMVGPRPERKHFTDELEKKIPFYSERFILKPGITGWAQISYRYGANMDDAIEKLNYDLFYIKNVSILMDAIILLRTAKTVLFSNPDGHFKIPHLWPGQNPPATE
ncbi:MAG: TIGR03013 family PEP-CTERM/XrtA system glycosyltransferase [Desulfobacula sp.]|uniref:TIGR03013 family XrtA/PEP-CTERM system glycosyltransferase n=1 Tax=Desulfobacula sp. TaxID=2593537 RepID=UPI001DB1561A|nr:TIGR03013 family PEP-CTERM/XrtA system glycosyltransferase [Desulfobacula sp.]MBT3485451.1 TIGR03013 family PEP-CTERM/XrtA system glycosyltransferase [Desulfobacula sp.]MBT3807847.1 TIGR03013 family PEP-CTERM/XrtA system glycosyltransferase [Desulfobacula sp.]MBT4026090.1 TIGR03013 family PEP-CTERM/XrtA system glycosyltransferase [Desulfobacula sp.]MBT5545118.1 TIGR03013 family PEP-CTERM/XrtA system glycosyltransferase [Desulfobacula sp.]